MRDSVRVLLNTISSWVATLASGLIGFLLVPFLLLKLGKEGYGLTALVGTIIGLTGILDLGLRSALSRQLAEQIARRNNQRFNELVSSAAALYIAMGFAFAALLVGFSPLIARLFRVSDHLMPQAVLLIRWYGSVSVLLSFVNPVFSATLIGLHRFDLVNLLLTVVGVLRGIGLFCVMGFFNTGLYGWAAVNLLAMLTSFAAFAIAAYRLGPDMRLSWRLCRVSALRPVFTLGGYMFLLQLTNALSIQSDPLVLTTFLGPVAVALYSPALALTSVFRPLVLSLADQLHPLATRLHVTQNSADLQAVLLRGTRYTLLMGIPVCVFLGLFSEPITRIWLAKSLHGDYRIVARVLVVWAVVDLSTYAGGTTWAVLLGIHKLKFLVWTQIPLAVFNIVLSVILVACTRLGVLGVVIPTMLVGLIRRPMMMVHTAHACGLSARRYYRESYHSAMIVLAMLAGFSGILEWCLPVRNLLWLAGEGGAIGLLSLILIWTLGLTESDRQIVRSILRHSKARIFGFREKASLPR